MIPAIETQIALKVRDLREAGVMQIPAEEFWQYLQLEKRGISRQEIQQLLPSLGITSRKDRGYLVLDILYCPPSIYYYYTTYPTREAYYAG